MGGWGAVMGGGEVLGGLLGVTVSPPPHGPQNWEVMGGGLMGVGG